mgnify:CR=1 FL=1
MLIPSGRHVSQGTPASLSRRVNANSQLAWRTGAERVKLIKKGEC